MPTRQRSAIIHHILSDIESEAMNILWKADKALTANEVVAEIFRGRHEAKIALPNYTTIASMLTRLVERGALISTKLSPRNIVYKPTLRRMDYIANLSIAITELLNLTQHEREELGRFLADPASAESALAILRPSESTNA